MHPHRQSRRSCLDLNWRLALLALALLAILGLIGSRQARAVEIPVGNIVGNAGFETAQTQPTWNWGGVNSSLDRQPQSWAKEGNHVVKVTATAEALDGDGNADTYSLDESGASEASATGAAPYSARAFVRGTANSDGRSIRLNVREIDPTLPVGDPGRTQIAHASVTLKQGEWKKITVQNIAEKTGNQVDVFLSREANLRAAGEGFFADAVSVVEGPPSPAMPSVFGQIGHLSYLQGVKLIDDIVGPPPLDGLFHTVVVGDDPARNRVDEIHQASPSTKVLVYKNLGLINGGGNSEICPGNPGTYYPIQGSGVHYCDADPEGPAVHEGWFMHRSGGAGGPVDRLHPSDQYSYNYMANIANVCPFDAGDDGGTHSSCYLEKWISNVSDRIEAEGYDGVFIDDLNVYLGHGLTEDEDVAESSLDTEQEYRKAALGALGAIDDQLGEDFLVMSNVGLTRANQTHREAAYDLAELGDVVTIEGFMGYDNARATGADFAIDLDYAQQLQERPAAIHALSYATSANDSPERQRYMYASFLLAWDGEDGSTFSYRIQANDAATYGPGWMSPAIGRPRAVGGTAQQVGTYRWRRYYEDGVVLVNASASGSYTFSGLEYGPYVLPNGSCGTSVQVAATDAYVLERC